MVLVDTSSWIEALRADGQTEVRERIRGLLLRGEVVFCDMVLLELWNGARGDREKKKLRQLEREIPCLPSSKEVWDHARDLARRCRAAGRTVPATDLLVAACAQVHGAELDHYDSHFDRISEATR